MTVVLDEKILMGKMKISIKQAIAIMKLYAFLYKNHMIDDARDEDEISADYEEETLQILRIKNGKEIVYYLDANDAEAAFYIDNAERLTLGEINKYL